MPFLRERSGRWSPIKIVAFVATILPALGITYQAWTRDLGARPITEAIHQSGDWALRLLLITLAITPARRLFDQNRLIQIRRIKRDLADRVQKSQSADVKAIAEQFTKEMSTVEEDVYQVRNQSNQDPLNFPIKTNNRLASLLRVVQAGDGKPLGNVQPIFNELQTELKNETDRLQRVLSTYLPRFNQLASRLGIEPISEK